MTWLRRKPKKSRRFESRRGLVRDINQTQAAIRFFAAGVLLTIVCWLAVTVASVPVWAQSATDRSAAAKALVEVDAASRRIQREKMESAAEALIRDAQLLDQYEPNGEASHLSRPHPAIRDWEVDMLEEALRRMTKPFTGHDYRDAYIRWHLLWIVHQAQPDQIRGVTDHLINLVKQMPDLIRIPRRREFTVEPENVYGEYERLVHSGDVAVGIPPFEKSYAPPQSYAYLSQERVAQVKKNLARAKRLKGKFKLTRHHSAVAFNERARFVEWVIRQYRGELIYSLIWTGDRKVALMVMDAIDRHTRTESGIALDLLNFLYQAAFSGALDRYDPSVRQQMSKRLKATALSSQSWKTYGGQQRNFADYAFHMVYLLADETGLDADESDNDSVVEKEKGS